MSPPHSQRRLTRSSSFTLESGQIAPEVVKGHIGSILHKYTENMDPHTLRMNQKARQPRPTFSSTTISPPSAPLQLSPSSLTSSSSTSTPSRQCLRGEARTSPPRLTLPSPIDFHSPTTSMAGPIRTGDQPDAAGSSSNQRASSSRPARRRKPSNPNHPPRPPNSFMLFRRDFFRRLAEENSELTKMPQCTLSKVISETWRTISTDVRAVYEQLAAVAKQKHMEMYPNYQYRPRKAEERERERKERQKERDALREEKRKKKEEDKQQRRVPSGTFVKVHTPSTPPPAVASSSKIELPQLIEPPYGRAGPSPPISEAPSPDSFFSCSDVGTPAALSISSSRQSTGPQGTPIPVAEEGQATDIAFSFGVGNTSGSPPPSTINAQAASTMLWSENSATFEVQEDWMHQTDGSLNMDEILAPSNLNDTESWNNTFDVSDPFDLGGSATQTLLTGTDDPLIYNLTIPVADVKEGTTRSIDYRQINPFGMYQEIRGGQPSSTNVFLSASGSGLNLQDFNPSSAGIAPFGPVHQNKDSIIVSDPHGRSEGQIVFNDYMTRMYLPPDEAVEDYDEDSSFQFSFLNAAEAAKDSLDPNSDAFGTNIGDGSSMNLLPQDTQGAIDLNDLLDLNAPLDLSFAELDQTTQAELLRLSIENLISISQQVAEQTDTHISEVAEDAQAQIVEQQQQRYQHQLQHTSIHAPVPTRFATQLLNPESSSSPPIPAPPITSINPGALFLPDPSSSACTAPAASSSNQSRSNGYVPPAGAVYANMRRAAGTWRPPANFLSEMEEDI